MKVLGVNTAHDSSVCIYEDGKILSYYKEERLSNIKKDNNPILATDKAIKDLESVDIVAYCDPSSGDAIHDYLKNLKKKINVYDVIDFSQEHHLQHAGLAFYNSGFKEAAVIVVDRNGSGFYNSARESETIFHASYPHNFKTVYKNYWLYNSEAQNHANKYRKDNPDVEVDVKSMHGIVKVYESATSLIHQHILENGKTMGLSAYGNADSNFPDLFVNGTNIPNDYYFGHELNDGENLESVYLDLTSLRNKNFTKHNVEIYADYALTVQQQTQEAVCYLIQKAIDRTGLKNIIITGGYGLNIVANSYYIKKFKDINFYFEPMADDSGTSIGGAMIAYRVITKDMEIYPLTTTCYHGQSYFIDRSIGKNCNVDDIVDLLISQKSIALYKGMSEAGPRALGNRSILFDARNNNAVDLINRIKNREWYRPFAAVILKEDCSKYFDMMGLTESRYMTMNFNSTDLAKKEIPGVIHVDGTCRIQTVDERDGILFDLLSKFKQRTGVGVLLNTSFNLAGKPLVETPDDAIRTLNDSLLDYIWFADFQILKSKDD